MTTPLTDERRLEWLERRTRDLEQIVLAMSRQPQGFAKRWTYWAQTVLPSEGSEEEYPGDGGDTFPITFVDPTYHRAIGTRTLTLPLRKTGDYQSVGRTTNGQWCLPGELVLASPIPPPPNTEGKGRWLIRPIKTYYYGFLYAPLGRLSSALANVYKQDPAGTWTDTGYQQTVWDGRFLAVGDELPVNTWVRFEWETCSWVVTNAACQPEELEE